MKKITSLIALFLSAILVLTACGGSNSQTGSTDSANENTAQTAEQKQVDEKQEKVVVKVWRHSGKPEEQEDFTKQVEAFKNANSNIVLETEVLPEGSYNDQINAAALSNGLPDLFMLDGPNMSNYAWSGYLRPLDEFMTDELKSDLLPSILAQGNYDGKIYAIGTFDSGLGIWANKAYLEKAGVRIPKSVADAWTLEELNEALEKLKALDEVEYPIDLKLNYGQGEWYTYGFAPIVWSFGGDLIDRKNLKADGVLNGPNTVKALEWFQSLFTKGYANPSQASDDDFYGAGKISALSLVGHWMAVPHKEGLGDNLVLLPMPKFGDKVVTGMGSWAWAMSSSVKKPSDAWKVLDFFLKPENIKATVAANGAIPARLSVVKSMSEYQEGGLLYIFREQLEKGFALERPTTPAYPVITAQFSEAVQNIIKGAAVKEQLDRAAKKIDEDIKDNNFYKK